MKFSKVESWEKGQPLTMHIGFFSSANIFNYAY